MKCNKQTELISKTHHQKMSTRTVSFCQNLVVIWCSTWMRVLFQNNFACNWPFQWWNCKKKIDFIYFNVNCITFDEIKLIAYSYRGYYGERVDVRWQSLYWEKKIHCFFSIIIYSLWPHEMREDILVALNTTHDTTELIVDRSKMTI